MQIFHIFYEKNHFFENMKHFMHRILFVCHGNICRSPMAESVMSDLVTKAGLEHEIEVASAAAHDDAIGWGPHRGTREILEKKGIPLVPHVARLMKKEDGEKFDFLIGMDRPNVRDMQQIVGGKNAHKVHMLLDFSSRPRPIADPWYTGNFDDSFRDILEGCEALLCFLMGPDFNTGY